MREFIVCRARVCSESNESRTDMQYAPAFGLNITANLLHSTSVVIYTANKQSSYLTHCHYPYRLFSFYRLLAKKDGRNTAVFTKNVYGAVSLMKGCFQKSSIRRCLHDAALNKHISKQFKVCLIHFNAFIAWKFSPVYCGIYFLYHTISVFKSTELRSPFEKQNNGKVYLR